MAKLTKFFKNLKGCVKFRYVVLALLVCCFVTGVIAADVFALFQTTIESLGESETAESNYTVTINGDATASGTVANVNIAGDALHPNNRDANGTVDAYYAAPNTAGYVPITIDGSDVQISSVITVTATFNSVPTLLTFEDGFGNAIPVKNGTTITYSYYFSYSELAVWHSSLHNIPLNIGFRWQWDASDSAAQTQIIANAITVSVGRVAGASNLSNLMKVHFADAADQFNYGDVINVLTADIDNDGSDISLTATDDLFIDMNGFDVQESLIITAPTNAKICLGKKKFESDTLCEIQGDLTVTAPSGSVTVNATVTGTSNIVTA